MLCQSCAKKPATTHIKTIVNGELSEHALCAECAKKMGYANYLFTDWGFNFGALLNGMPSTEPLSQKPRCSFCGASFSDLAKQGKVGCAECYHTFHDRLLPSIQRIHGNTQHRGKCPGAAAMIPKPESALQVLPQDELARKKKQLQDAIQEQNFELAACLRDEIKVLEEAKSNE